MLLSALAITAAMPQICAGKFGNAESPPIITWEYSPDRG